MPTQSTNGHVCITSHPPPPPPGLRSQLYLLLSRGRLCHLGSDPLKASAVLKQVYGRPRVPPPPPGEPPAEAAVQQGSGKKRRKSAKPDPTNAPTYFDVYGKQVSSSNKRPVSRSLLCPEEIHVTIAP